MSMNRERYQHIKELLHRASALEAEARRCFLDGACREDIELRREVEALLAPAANQVATPLDHSPIQPNLLRHALIDSLAFMEDGPVPLSIGKYRVLRRIGQGGMGVVYEAEQDKPRRRVALKVIRPTIASPEWVRRFEREAYILGQLQHPGIAQVFEAGTAPMESANGSTMERAYFAMELISGLSLKEYCDGHSLGVRERLQLMALVCDAVQYAHQKGVVHRDLKPANILVVDEGKGADEGTKGRRDEGTKKRTDEGAKGRRAAGFSPRGASEKTEPRRQKGTKEGIDAPSPQNAKKTGSNISSDSSPPLLRRSVAPSPSVHSAEPKILDFGVARLVGPNAQLITLMTEVGQLVGTLAYMSPEQVSGDSSQVDTRSDVYSLGVILYELLADRLPLEVGPHSIVEAARLIRDVEPRRLSSIRSSLRGEVSTIVEKALEKDPQRRFSSAAELAADLRRFLQDEPIMARPPTATYLLRKFARRHRGLVAGAATAVAALVIGLAGTTWFAVEAGRAHRQADARADQLRRELYASRIHHIARVIETEGPDPVRDMLRDCDQTLRDWEWQRLHWLSDRSEATLPADQHRAHSISFSADGYRILTAGNGSGIRLWEVSTLQPIRLYPQSEACHSAQFGARETRIVGCGRNGRVLVWNAEDGTLIWDHIFESDVRIEAAALDPTGRRLVVGWWAPGARTEIWDPTTSTHLFSLAEPASRGVALQFSQDGSKILVGALSGAVSVSDARDGSLYFHERGAESVVLDAVYDADEKRIASIGNDGRVLIRDARSGQLLRSFDTRKGRSQTLAFHPNGETLAVGSIDGVLTLFNADTGDRVGSLRGHDHEILTVSFHPNGHRVATCAIDGTAKIWSLDVIHSAHAHSAPLKTLCFSADGHSVLFAGGGSGLLRVRLPLSDVHIVPFGGSLPAVNEISASPDGRWVGLWVSDGAWENAKGIGALLDGQLGLRHEWPCDQPWRISFSSDGQKMLALDSEGSLWLRDTPSGEPIRKFDTNGDQVKAAAFSMDGGHILAGSQSGRVRAWEASNGRNLADFAAHSAPIKECAVIPKGNLLVSCAWDDNRPADEDPLRIWDWTLGSLVREIPNIGRIATLAVHPLGNRLATGGFDGAVRLWDVESGRELLTVGRHQLPVLSVVFSLDGKTLASCGRDHTLRLWETAPLDFAGKNQ